MSSEGQQALRLRLAYFMRRFLFLALFAALLSPTVAKADDFKVRDTCGRHNGGFISAKEAHRRLGLEKTYKRRGIEGLVNFNEEEEFWQDIAIGAYCKGYKGSSDSVVTN